MSIQNLSHFLKPVREIFVYPLYLTTWLSLSTLIFSLALFYPNLRTIIYISTETQISLTNKLVFIASLYGGLFNNLSSLILVTTFTITALTATQIVLLYRLIRTRGHVTLRHHGTMTFFGATLATLGLGCAACGALILGSLLSVAGGTWLLTYLPWQGQEIVFLAIIVLGLGNYFILERLNSPLVC